MREWLPIGCELRDRIFADLGENAGVESALTDISGEFGDPSMYTEWNDRRTGTVVLLDRRYPNIDAAQPDRKPCEHYVPVAARGDGEQA